MGHVTLLLALLVSGPPGELPAVGPEIHGVRSTKRALLITPAPVVSPLGSGALDAQVGGRLGIAATCAIQFRGQTANDKDRAARAAALLLYGGGMVAGTTLRALIGGPRRDEVRLGIAVTVLSVVLDPVLWRQDGEIDRAGRWADLPFWSMAGVPDLSTLPSDVSERSRALAGEVLRAGAEVASPQKGAELLGDVVEKASELVQEAFGEEAPAEAASADE